MKKDYDPGSVAEGFRLAAQFARLKNTMAMAGMCATADLTFDRLAEELENVASHLERSSMENADLH